MTDASSGPLATRIGKRGTFVIPARFRKALHLEEGTSVIAEARDGGLFIRPFIEDGIPEARRRAVLEAASQAYAALRTDPRAWTAQERERAVWQSLAAETLPSEPWSDDAIDSAE